MRWNIGRLFSAKSFRAKLVLVSVVCILIPALGTLVVYNYLTRDAVKDQAVQNADQTLKLVEGHVAGELQHMLYLMNYFTVNEEMNYTLRELASQAYERSRASVEQYTAGQLVIKSIDSLTAAGQKSFLTVVLKNGMAFTNYQLDEYDPQLLLGEPWLGGTQGAYGLQSHWVGVLPTVFRLEKSANPFQITVARPLRGYRQEITGYVVVTIMESQIRQYFNELPTKQEIMVLDQNDRIISHSDPVQVGKPFPYLKNALPQPESNIISINGDDFLLSRREITINGWTLVSLTPYKSAVAKINDIFESVFIFQLVSFVFFFLLLLLALRAFTVPLVKLDKVALRVQTGDLAVRSAIRGQDEVGRLGKSFDQMLDRISDMIVEITETQVRKREAELDMLQAQINPHFLFNVLNSIRMKVMGQGDRESADMLSSLSRLLRMTIQEKGLIPLHDEVEIVIDYVKLMNMRQKQKVSLEVDIAVEVFLERVPRFFLQPVIENALIHGLSQREGTIHVRAKADSDCIRLEVQDDGAGMDEQTLAQLRARMTGASSVHERETGKRSFSGIGLPNVYERLRMTFGESFRMVVDSEQGLGTCVTLYLPKNSTPKSDGMSEKEEESLDV
ncbi:MAG: histidine kinase [Paenibacillaceae bacterium]|jgi:two-component system sensor histidine kinase YesM|nr:histidine kinase [Paenibacillaceae bacterium]